MRTALVLSALSALLALPAPGQDAGAFTTGGPVQDGVRAACDLDPRQHMRNTGGSDGAGLCVFTSVEVAGRWQNVPELAGLQRYMTRYPGGGYPEKLARVIEAHCKEKGVPVPNYVQHTGGDEEFLDAAVKTGRMVCITYAGQDNFYRGGIYHMVCQAHLDGEKGAIIDNNDPGRWRWMSRKELLSRWRGMSGGWAVVLLAPSPPPYKAAPSGFPAVEQLGPTPPEGVSPPGPDFEWAFTPGVGWGWRQKPEAPPDGAGGPQPAGPPAAAQASNFGIDTARIAGARKRYWVGDREVSRREAMDAVEFPDDSAKWHLTAVGTEEFKASVKAAVAQLDPADRDKVRFQGYAPDRWEVAQFSLPPGVSIRKPAGPGRVGPEVGVLAAEGFTPEKLRALIDLAFRGKRPAGPVGGDALGYLLLAGGLALLVFLLATRRKS